MDADQEAYCLIGEKANHPHWGLSDYSIDVDPRSRMYDPNNPDCPPIPTDDPYSHALMHWVDAKKGYPGWHSNGDTSYVENPSWLDFLELDENGVLVIDAEGSFQLAKLHSPDYQSQFETLYLNALDVTSQRFQFDSQWFAGYSTGFRSVGPLAGGPSNQLDGTTRGMQVRRAFSTGASAVVGFANALVWEFSGPNGQSVSSTIDFTIIQPLLRSAGRDVILEGLTQVERNLLGNVRQIERYRRGFFLDIVFGVGRQAGPSRGGGFFNTVGTGSTGGAGGYLGLLQNLQVIRNQETNIAALESSLAQLVAFRDAGRVEFIQVEQVRQQLFSSNAGLLRSRRGFNDSLDQYKANLGIPPQVPVKLDDPMLDRFQLIDPEINELQNLITELQNETGELLISLREMVREKKPWDDEYVRTISTIAAAVRRGEELRDLVLEKYAENTRDSIDNLVAAVPDRVSAAKRILARKAEIDKVQVTASEVPLLASVNDTLFNTAELDGIPTELTRLLEEIVARMEKNAAMAESILAGLVDLAESGGSMSAEELIKFTREEVGAKVPSLFTNLSANVIEMSLIQASARAEAITLSPIEITPEIALEIARVSRRDWMNARAALVDSWRQIEVVADDLESQLDIVFSGNVNNFGANGFDFRGDAGTLRARLEFDAPLTRLLERNGYRQVLITYQQARRKFYQIEDAIAAQTRATLRQVDQSKIEFELQRNALRIAVAQVQSARFQLEEPPTGVSARPATLGPTTANNLIQALSSLRTAQDSFLGVWVNYEIQRAILDLNMGTMDVDDGGVWLDPGAIGLEYGYPNVADLPLQCRIPPNPSWLIPPGSDAIFSAMPAGDEFPAMHPSEPMLADPMSSVPEISLQRTGPIRPLNAPVHSPEQGTGGPRQIQSQEVAPQPARPIAPVPSDLQVVPGPASGVQRDGPIQAGAQPVHQATQSGVLRSGNLHRGQLFRREDRPAVQVQAASPVQSLVFKRRNEVPTGDVLELQHTTPLPERLLTPRKADQSLEPNRLIVE